ncbi:MAG TPA: divalent-cation tolerance protein CutA [Nitrospiria bacterium]|nr:divalent-cation tolerance protein CutA [Nitrospiria bacterium]
MTPSDELIMVLVTTPHGEMARAIARRLVDARLAACVNMVSSVESVYRWQGQRCEEAEWLMVIKSRRSLFEQLAAEVKVLHSYTVPEIIALPIVAGAPDYLQWICDSTALNR